MKFYTSYFAQMRNFPKNLIGLSTAVWNPKWLSKGRSQNGIIWLDVPPLKPGPECEGLCFGKCEPKHPQNCEFLKTYRAQLDKIDFKDFISKIEELRNEVCAGEKFEDIDIAFLVFEKYDNPCSERIVIQQWFKDNGMEIKEWMKIMNGLT